jgi:hypothetical protein
MQLALYLYLRNTTKGIFAIGFLEGKDYAAPEEFEASNHDIQVANFEIDRNLLDKYIQFATK